MKWRIAGVVTALVAAGLMVGAVLGIWTATQTASGGVNATVTTAPNLYLCEPGTGDCGQDDSGADEQLFESAENLLPAAFASDQLRLRNVGSQGMDVVRAVTVVSESTDPGADCGALPTVRIGVLSPEFPGPFGSGDDHSFQFAQATGLQAFPRALNDPRYDSLFGGQAIHIAPGGHEDVALQVLLRGDAPRTCEDNAWNVSITWEVVAVSH